MSGKGSRTKVFKPKGNPLASYQEKHFDFTGDVGVAWDGTHVWVCINGMSLFRAKIMGKKLLTEFYSGVLIDATSNRNVSRKLQQTKKTST